MQAYTINQAKVVFLNARPQAKMGAPADSDACRSCSRTLREGFSYCCLACKVRRLAMRPCIICPLWIQQYRIVAISSHGLRHYIAMT